MSTNLNIFVLLGLLIILTLCIVIYRVDNTSNNLDSSRRRLSRQTEEIPATEHTITSEQLSAAKEAISNVLNLIRYRYELGGPIGSNFFNTANNWGE